MSDFDKNTILLVLIFVLVMLGCLGSVVGMNTLTTYQQCARYQEYMPDQNLQWDFWTACLIEAPDGTFVSADDYFSMNRLGLFLDEVE